MRRLLALANALLAAFGSATGAQGLPHSHHFGAIYNPRPETIWELGVSFDRFTNHTKPSDSTAARERGLFDTKTRHYGLQSTLGINTAYLSHSHRLRRLSSILGLGVFYGELLNGPSDRLQNNFRHRDLGIDFVPWETVERGRLYGAVASIDRWVDVMPRNKHLNLAAYAGIDGSISSLLDDIALRMGIRTTYIEIGGWQYPPQFGLHLRKGVYVGGRWQLREAPRDTGAADMDEVIANTYTTLGWTVRLPLSSWLRNRSLVPDLVVAYTDHSGLFLAQKRGDTTFSRMPETFQSFAVEWGGGDVTIETYNDSPGNKDIGPTFGARAFWRWRYWGKRK